MNKETLDNIKECINKINDAMFFESVFGEIQDLIEDVSKLIQAYEELLKEGA